MNFRDSITTSRRAATTRTTRSGMNCRAILSLLPAAHPDRAAFNQDAPTLEIQRLLDSKLEADQVGRIGVAYKAWEDRCRPSLYTTCASRKRNAVTFSSRW